METVGKGLKPNRYFVPGPLGEAGGREYLPDGYLGAEAYAFTMYIWGRVMKKKDQWSTNFKRLRVSGQYGTPCINVICSKITPHTPPTPFHSLSYEKFMQCFTPMKQVSTDKGVDSNHIPNF